MMAFSSVLADFCLGLCRKAPVYRVSPACDTAEHSTAGPARPGGSAPSPSPGSIRDGIGIATASIRALFVDTLLRRFMLLSGLVMLSLLLIKWWEATHETHGAVFLISVPPNTELLMNSVILIDTSVLLLEIVCLSCFTLVLAGITLYRKHGYRQARDHGLFTGINCHTWTLLSLTILLAVIAWLGLEVISQFRFLGRIVFGFTMAVAHLPYAYYIPNDIVNALFLSFNLMFINLPLLVIALYVIPGIVLENKRLIPALAGAASLMKRTWRESLGCIIVLFAVILAISIVALVIGQSPVLLNYDYDFFLQVSRGQVLMTAVCYGFIFACWAMMAAGLTAAGVAVADIYMSAKGEIVPTWQ